MPISATLPPLTPVTATCIERVSQVHNLPATLFYAMLAVEGGAVGMRTRNKNGSSDSGPMQINTIWLKQLNTLSVDEAKLTNQGCTNVAIGAAILNRYIHQKKDLWAGVGRYNASDRIPQTQRAYSNKVAKAMMTLTEKGKQAILDAANRLIQPPICGRNRISAQAMPCVDANTKVSHAKL